MGWAMQTEYYESEVEAIMILFLYESSKATKT